MDKITGFEACKTMEYPALPRRIVYPDSVSLFFDAAPRIANRSDALELLDTLITADFIENLSIAFEALRDAIKREII
jgi:hypothetical protein